MMFTSQGKWARRKDVAGLLQRNVAGENAIWTSAARCACAAILAMMLFCPAETAYGQQHGAAESAATASTTPPPMGWGSWNSFSNTIDSQIVMAQAKAMATSGMRDAGYRYVLLDEGWWRGERDKNGDIAVDPHQWPAIQPGEKDGDIRNIVRYIHSLGLKAAIYTDAGPFGCGTDYPDIGPSLPNTGSLGHYDQDFLDFARWGFDYVKVDWCGGEKMHLDPAFQYGQIARAIARAVAITHHPLYFSLCEWGRQSPWTWAPGIGGLPSDMWRSGGDIIPPILLDATDAKHMSRVVTLKNVFVSFDAGMHPEAQHTGYYNDLDMMVIGMRGMSDVYDRVHMGLWAISSAPLIVGSDLTRLNAAQIAVLTNREVLAVDQDALGLQAVMVSEPAPGLQVWAKPLAGHGRRAVLLLNRTDAAQSLSVHWASLGLDPAAATAVRDLWSHKALGAGTAEFETTVPAQDALLLSVFGADAKTAVYKPSPAAPSNGLEQGAGRECSAAPDGGRFVDFADIKTGANATYLRIHYFNRSNAARMVQMRVNHQSTTVVQLPPEAAHGSAESAVSVEVNFDSSDNRNAIEFRIPCSASDLAISSIEVSPWSK
jgi:Alpha galactosidase A/Alpha galactosidase C-terminal beta sandwich domain